MAIQINSATTTLFEASSKTQAPISTQSAPDTAVVKATAPQADTVKLSLSSRIHQLKTQGLSANQIATSLGVDTKTVATYFSGSSTTSTSAATTSTSSGAGTASSTTATGTTVTPQVTTKSSAK